DAQERRGVPGQPEGRGAIRDRRRLGDRGALQQVSRRGRPHRAEDGREGRGRENHGGRGGKVKGVEEVAGAGNGCARVAAREARSDAEPSVGWRRIPHRPADLTTPRARLEWTRLKTERRLDGVDCPFRPQTVTNPSPCPGGFNEDLALVRR